MVFFSLIKRLLYYVSVRTGEQVCSPDVRTRVINVRPSGYTVLPDGRTP